MLPRFLLCSRTDVNELAFSSCVKYDSSASSKQRLPLTLLNYKAYSKTNTREIAEIVSGILQK